MGDTEGILIKSTRTIPPQTVHRPHAQLHPEDMEVHEINSQNNLPFFRIFSKKNEIMVVLDTGYFLMMIQNLTKGATLGSLYHSLL